MAGPATGRPRLRVLHTSDVHLGAYDSGDPTGDGPGARKRRAMHDTFAAVVDLGLRERVDLFVIAGDFFDNARVWEDTARFAAAEIARLGVPTVLLPGNHDHVGSGSVYDRFDLAGWAQNLALLRDPAGELVTLEALGVALWGRSHVEDGRPFSPFDAAPGRADLPWHIGVGHGHYLHPDSGHHPSYHIREEELAILDHDYVALGHWEQQRRVAAGAVVAAYSGAPEGLGTAGGRALIADMRVDGTVRLESHPLHGGDPLHHDDIPLVRGVAGGAVPPALR